MSANGDFESSARRFLTLLRGLEVSDKRGAVRVFREKLR